MHGQQGTVTQQYYVLLVTLRTATCEQYFFYQSYCVWPSSRIQFLLLHASILFRIVLIFH
uniref:Uncharacterized protein n=1 Tax=Rhizophora mucronata TaxID=61149 RepID=A0A2P2NR23_RHIMU